MTNAYDEFSKKLDEKIVEPLRQVNKGRRLVYVTPPQGFGVTSVDWGKMTEMSDGYVSMGFTDGNKDSIDVKLTNAQIPVYWKDYTIDRRIYEGWRTRGFDIDAANAIAAAYKASRAEDGAIINGVTNDGTNYDFVGIYQGAVASGNNYATSCSIGTFGNLTSAINAAYELMDEDGVPVDSLPFNLALNSTSFKKARSVRNTGGNGNRELPDILELLNGGSVISVGTQVMTGQGFLCPTPAVGEPYLDYYLTSDFQTDPMTPMYQKTGNLGGRVFSAGVLRIKQFDALCAFSNLS